MNDYRTWRPVYRAMCPEPGPRDVFLVILVNGKRMKIVDAAEHEHWRKAADRLADEHKCQVKVLPMNDSELMNFLGFPPGEPQPIENLDPEFRKQAIQNCKDTLRESFEQREREVALELLGHLVKLQ